MNTPGVIQNREYKQQIADFSGLRFGKITPTDLDAFIDFGGKLFVFVEAKYGDSLLKRGQELALERLCDASHKPPTRFSVAFVVSHTSKGDIDFANTTVTRFRWGGKWYVPQQEDSTLLDGVVAFRNRCLGADVIPIRRRA